MYFQEAYGKAKIGDKLVYGMVEFEMTASCNTFSQFARRAYEVMCLTDMLSGSWEIEKKKEKMTKTLYTNEYGRIINLQGSLLYPPNAIITIEWRE